MLNLLKVVLVIISSYKFVGFSYSKIKGRIEKYKQKSRKAAIKELEKCFERLKE